MNFKDNFIKWALTKDRPLSEYQEVLERIKEGKNSRLLHGVLGISGESGELLDSVKKTIIYGKELDLTNIKEEVGDILWYISLILSAIDSSFDEVMQLNQDKLNKRYPNGYTNSNAIKRLDKNELPENT